MTESHRQRATDQQASTAVTSCHPALWDTERTTTEGRHSVQTLVVDDDPTVLELLGDVLSHQTHLQVTALHDSRQALESLYEKDYDVLITDLKMPDVDGLTLAKTVEELGRNTQVILISGYATPDMRREAQERNVFAFLSKPFRMSALIQTVNQAATAAGLM